MSIDKLISEIKDYSRRKRFFVWPFSIIAIAATIVLITSPVLNIFIEIPQICTDIAGVAMISGIIVPLVAVFFLENRRNRLIEIDLCTYITALAEEPQLNNGDYYELIDILRSAVYKKYISSSPNGEYYDVINIFKKILFENSRNGLANPFVYNNRKGFYELCKFIETQTIKSGTTISLGTQIYDKYRNLNSEKLNTTVDKKHILTPKSIMWIVKILLLFLCIIFYWFPKLNGWIFNGVAIILLLIDIMKEKREVI